MCVHLNYIFRDSNIWVKERESHSWRHGFPLLEPFESSQFNQWGYNYNYEIILLRCKIFSAVVPVPRCQIFNECRSWSRFLFRESNAFQFFAKQSLKLSRINDYCFPILAGLLSSQFLCFPFLSGLHFFFVPSFVFVRNPWNCFCFLFFFIHGYLP